jgi:hypothetical protein
MVDASSSENEQLNKKSSLLSEQLSNIQDDLEARITEVKSLRETARDKFRLELEVSQANA